MTWFWVDRPDDNIDSAAFDSKESNVRSGQISFGTEKLDLDNSKVVFKYNNSKIKTTHDNNLIY